MVRLRDRSAEALFVAAYALLSGTVVILSLLVLQIDAPFVGVFVVFWLVAACVLAAVATAAVVIVSNVRRARSEGPVDRVATALGATMLASVAAAAYFVFADSPQYFLAAGVLGLLVAPLGLLLRVFDADFHSLLRSRQG